MTYFADVDTTAGDVKVGDQYRVITGSTDHAVEIAKIKIGTKWTEARDADGTLIWRKLSTDQIWLMRETKTDEELAEEKAENEKKVAAWHEEQLTRMLEKMNTRLHEVQTKLSAELVTGAFISESILEDLLVAQEYKVIAAQIESILDRNPGMTVKDAMEHVAEQIKERLITGYDEPTWSGGFTIGNAARQTRIVARRKFINGIGWGTL
jgi:hypothetical protein